MVLDMRRLSPWGPSSAKPTRRKFEVRAAVARLEGLAWPVFGEGAAAAAVRVRWKGPKSQFGRPKKADRVTGRAAVGANGMAEFAGCGNGFGCISGLDPLRDWEVFFSVLYVKGQEEKKLEEIGTKSINLGDWLQASRVDAEVEGKKSQLHVHKKQIPITLRKNGLIAEATLHVDVSFVEIRKSKETSDTQVLSANENTKDEGETTDDSCTFDPENSELGQLLFLADETEKMAEYKSRIGTASTSHSNANTSSSSSARSSPDQLHGSVSKRRFLPWGKSSKIASKSYDGSEISNENQSSSNSSPSKESEEINRIEDPIGSWESTELISRDRQTKLKSQTFFASIDQRDESAGGESACTALVAVIADALHSKAAYTPTRSEFDTLIREGSSEWQKLCNDASYMNRFRNKHFDLDTILEARVRPISVLPEKSFIGFFQPESFQSLHGAMSFDDIWNEITNDAGKEPRIYIVSWNDHFFVLKVDSDVYYIIDTLGERLFEGCTKAYMLKFEDSTEMYRLSENNEERDGPDGDEVICSGKECCKEFIKRFLAAIPLREELEVEEKGTGNPNTALHQRLQIEFHLTEAAPNAVGIDDIAWW